MYVYDQGAPLWKIFKYCPAKYLAKIKKNHVSKIVKTAISGIGILNLPLFVCASTSTLMLLITNVCFAYPTSLILMLPQMEWWFAAYRIYRSNQGWRQFRRFRTMVAVLPGFWFAAGKMEKSIWFFRIRLFKISLFLNRYLGAYYISESLKKRPHFCLFSQICREIFRTSICQMSEFSSHT